VLLRLINTSAKSPAERLEKSIAAVVDELLFVPKIVAA
jgi:hypothetical protein